MKRRKWLYGIAFSGLVGILLFGVSKTVRLGRAESSSTAVTRRPSKPIDAELQAQPGAPPAEHSAVPARVPPVTAPARYSPIHRVSRAEVSSAERMEQRLKAALNIKADLRGGSGRWLKTVLEVESLFFAQEERRACGRDLGSEIEEECRYSLDMAIDRTGDTTGKIVAAQARVEDDDKSVEACFAFASCIAAGRLDKSVPLPPDADREYAISQKLIAAQPDSDMDDLEYLQAVVDAIAVDLEKFRGTANLNSVADQYDLEANAMFLQYVRELYAEKAREQGVDPSKPTQ